MDMEIDENLLSLGRGITEEETRALAERKRQHIEKIEQEQAENPPLTEEALVEALRQARGDV